MRRPIAPTTRLRVLWRDLYRCRYCQTSLLWQTMWIDHVIPVAKGGMNWKNLVACCETCNRSKSVYSWQPQPIAQWQEVLSAIMILIFDQASLLDWLVETVWYRGR